MGNSYSQEQKCSVILVRISEVYWIIGERHVHVSVTMQYLNAHSRLLKKNYKGGEMELIFV